MQQVSTMLISLTEAQETIQRGIEQLLNIVAQYHFESDEQLMASLDKLRKRAVSKEITLTVLGEFSAGKTTFVNSLLGTDVLRTGILPTTAACTYISHGATSSCDVVLQNGMTVTLSPKDFAQFSVDGTRAAEVDSLRLRLPNSLLEPGLVVIDTPGVNVNIEAHEALTAHAISESNACVYLMDARQPGKKTTIEFLRRLHGQVDKFFFVLNRADILDDRETEEALDFVQHALQDECGIANARVVPLSSALADDHGTWELRFHNFKRDLQSFMASERRLVIASEAARLASVVNKRAGHLLNNKWSVAEQELAKHHKVKLPESHELIAKLRKEITDHLETDAAELRCGFREYHQQVTSTLRTSLVETVGSARSKEDLTGSVQSAIASTFNNSTQRLQDYLLGHLRDTFDETSSRVTKGVRYLLRGISVLEDRAFFSGPFPYLLSLVGGIVALGIAFALFSDSPEPWYSPALLLFITSGCLSGLVIARLLWARRTRFSPPPFDSLDPRAFASQAGSGFLFAYEKSRGTMIVSV